MKSVLYGVFLISVSALLTSCSVLEDVWPQNLPVFSEAESSAQAENSASPEERLQPGRRNSLRPGRRIFCPVTVARGTKR